MSKDHYEAGFGHHVIAYHDVITRQHNDGLFAGYAFAIVTVVMAPVVLTRFQRRQAQRPIAFVTIFHEIVEYVGGTTTFD